MSTATIIDTETTGFDEPDVIELAWRGPILDVCSPVHITECRRFKPRKPISLGAMAVHHILDHELEGHPEWTGSWTPPGDFIIGHSVDFDWKAIGSPPMRRICTLALSRALWPDLDSHSLGAMTYYLTPQIEARDLLKGAHGAVTDVDLCCRLLEHIMVAMPLIKTWDRLWDASEKARIPLRMSFGKYGPHEAWAKSTGQKGMLCKEVHAYDPGYWNWLMSKCDQVRDDPYLHKALTA
jgi:exodeoxyribonuclease X